MEGAFPRQGKGVKVCWRGSIAVAAECLHLTRLWFPKESWYFEAGDDGFSDLTPTRYLVLPNSAKQAFFAAATNQINP